MSSLDTLFSTIQQAKNSRVKKTTLDASANEVNREAKNLEYKMNLFFANKHKDHKRITFTQPDADASSSHEIYDLINKDIHKHMSKPVPWSSLCLYEKWKYVKEFVRSDTTGVFAGTKLNVIKGLLSNNMLLVTFDKDKKQVTNISM